MSERATRLSETADRQISELLDLLQATDASALSLPCPGREKLGDGTVGALANHTADNYRRIGEFVATSNQISAGHGPSPHGGHRIPRFMQALGHTSPDHGESYTMDAVDPTLLKEQLSDARRQLARIGQLSDAQLDTIPPSGSFRFCDGQRTVEQVLSGLLKHQVRQIDALKAAVA